MTTLHGNDLLIIKRSTNDNKIRNYLITIIVVNII